MSVRKVSRRLVRPAVIFLMGLVLLMTAGAAGATGTTEQSGGATEPSASAPAAAPSDSAQHRTLEALGSTDLQTFIAGMEADRLLLAEVRKDLPDKRADADLYLKRLKDLAAKSDPVRLVPKVNRLMEQEPIYYDWLEKNANSQNQNQSASDYVVGGARGFVVAFQDFENTLLLTVINRLDIAERALQEATVEPAK